VPKSWSAIALMPMGAVKEKSAGLAKPGQQRLAGQE